MESAAILCTETDAGWLALCEGLSDVCGLGESEDEARADLASSIVEHLRRVTVH